MHESFLTKKMKKFKQTEIKNSHQDAIFFENIFCMIKYENNVTTLSQNI